MPNLMALKLKISTFMLLWFASPIFAKPWTATSSTPCVTKVLEGVCSELFVDHTKCCDTILDQTRTDLKCMCNAFDIDESFINSFVSNCLFIGNIYEDVDTLCHAGSTTVANLKRSTNSTKSAGSTSSVRRLYTTPTYDDGTSAAVNAMIIYTVVVPLVVIIVVIIIIVVSVICICKSQQVRVRPNAYTYVSKGHELPLPSPISTNLVPLAPSTMTKLPRTLPRVTYKEDLKTAESQQYDLETLQAATNNFSIDNKIGGGAFGLVYKGKLLDGREIAVKRLSHESSQGEKEFKAEIELLTKLQHRNLVRLLGFCLKNGEALLVYELVTNKSLDYFLFDNKKREELTWPVRFQIIKGIARGLLYLHDDSPQRTIHRDLKAPNVLLDAEMNPKIADFGLARTSALKQTHVHTSKIAGTDGYISPEYRYLGKFSTKSDVYAFGALVLEIIGGRSIGSQSGDLPENLMGTAWRCWTDGKPLELMDAMLKDSCSRDEVLKCVHLGLLCLHDNVDQRPDMSTVVHKLNSTPEAATLAMPQPGIFYNFGSDQSNTSLTTQSVTSSTSDVSSNNWPAGKFKDCR